MKKNILLLVIISAVIFLFIKEILSPIVFSIIFAYIFLPVQKRFEKVLGKRLSAFLIVSIIFSFFLIISIFFAVKIYSLVLEIWEKSRRFEKFGKEIVKFEEGILNLLFQNITSITFLIPKTLVNLSIFFFLFYYFLADRERFLKYLREVIPEFDYFASNIKKTLNAILYGHFLTAILQGFLCLVFFSLFNAPYVIFFSILSFFLAAIGITPALVYIPLGIYKIISSSWLEGVGILASGIFVISTVDNFVKPKLSAYDIHPAIFLISMVGGIYVFGFSGMFIGPLVFGLIKAVMEYVETKS